MFVQLTKPFLGRQAGERIDVAEADGQALVKEGLAVTVTDDLLTPAVAKAVEGAVGKLTQALDGGLQQFAAAQAKARKNAVPALFGAGPGGDPQHCFGDWLLCVRRGDRKRLHEEYGSRFAEWEQKAALNTSTGTQGGYTVPAEFLPRLLQAAAEQAVVRPRATVIPMTGRSVQVPALDVATAPAAGDTAFFGGLVARWAEEATALTETEPTFKQIELVAHELSGYSKISNQLLADNAVGLEALLVRLFGGAIAWFEDYAFLRGDGAGKPLGAVGGAATWAKGVTRNTANDFKLQDAGSMIGALLPGWGPRTTCWCISPTVLTKVVQMVSSAAGVGWLDNLRDELPMKLLGLPVFVTEKLPALGTAKDVVLVDWQHYLIGDRRQIEIDFSEHVAFLTNQGVWRFACRVDGQPWLRSPVTLSDAATTVSPYVYLN